MTKSILVTTALFFMLSACSTTTQNKSEEALHIKRPALWVPDLDRAVVFFRDAIGLEVQSMGELGMNDKLAIADLFNADPKLTIRRAIFSSEVAERVLFVMETEDAPEYTPGDKRFATLVIRTNDLAAVEARAKTNGFEIGYSSGGTSSSGRSASQLTIFGPDGLAVLMYQLGL